VIKLIEQENERTRQCIDHELKEEIAQEILNAYDSGAETVPELGPTGQYLYYAKDLNGQRLFHRKHVDSGKEQLVLDISFHEYQVHAMSLSVKESFLAYLVSPVASPSQTIVRIRHLDSGREFDLPPENFTIANVEWGPIQDDGSDTLFFTTSNEKGRPCAVYACSVEADGEISSSPCVYGNDDEAVMVDVQRTKGCKYMAIYASTKTSSEIFLVGSVNHSPMLGRPRQEGVLYHIDVGVKDDVFLLAHAAEPLHKSGLSEEMALFETSLSAFPLNTSFGKQCAGADDEYIIADMDVFKDFVALYERSTVDGRHRIRLQMRTTTSHGEEDAIIPLPPGSGDCAVLSTGGNMCYTSTSLRFRVESPCSPGRTFSYDTKTGAVEALSSEKILSRFVEERVFVTSLDGTQVPMSLIYLDNEIASDSSPRPTVLIGYGAYGEPVCHGFDPTILPLLSRGFVIAYAHTRGGGELGRAWYRAGRLYEKERVIEDYISCAEALVGSLRITTPRLLTGKAFSAGGVTVAGAVNRRPSLFGSVVLTNPYLDVVTSMRNTDLALTEHEWNEWGDTLRDDKAARSVSSYCPMTNVTPQEYPKTLVVGATDDKNVPYWHPVSFCLKIRRALEACKAETDSAKDVKKQRVLLHIEPSGGHQLHGSKLEVAAMETAFIIKCQHIGDD